jgi:hypothetical protein
MQKRHITLSATAKHLSDAALPAQLAERIVASHGVSQDSVRIAAPASDTVRVALVKDPATGLYSWVKSKPTVRVADERVFDFAELRSPLSDLLHTYFVDFKIHDLLAEIIADAEQTALPYGLWHFTKDTYRAGDNDDIDGSFWTGGPRLLCVIHGFLGRVSWAFGGPLGGPLDASTVEQLQSAYGNQILGFDHPTLSVDPKENASELLRMLPTPPSPVTVDFLCHSRGGLVAREAIQQITAAHGNLRVGKVLFGGTPNAGTQLAKTNDALLKLFTNLLFQLGGGLVGRTLDLLGQVFASPFKLLDAERGLAAMVINSPELNALNATVLAASDERYYGIAASYEGGRDAFADALEAIVRPPFQGERNDIVVPTDGVFGPAQSPHTFRIPAVHAHVLDDRKNWHATIFSAPETQALIRQILIGP